MENTDKRPTDTSIIDQVKFNINLYQSKMGRNKEYLARLLKNAAEEFACWAPSFSFLQKKSKNFIIKLISKLLRENFV